MMNGKDETAAAILSASIFLIFLVLCQIIGYVTGIDYFVIMTITRNSSSINFLLIPIGFIVTLATVSILMKTSYMKKVFVVLRKLLKIIRKHQRIYKFLKFITKHPILTGLAAGILIAIFQVLLDLFR